MSRKLELDFCQRKTKKIALIALLILLLLVAVFIYFYQTMTPEDNIESQITSSENAEAEENLASIYVDITGAVNEPSVIVLPEGSRVFEAIEAAGGLTDDANLTNINRAEVLEDGTYLYIPTNKEMAEEQIAASSGMSGGSAMSSTSDKININTADSATLQQLNGVGPATAEKIIDYRTNTGRFKKIEDLTNVSGIGEKTFEKLKDHIKT